MGPTMQESVSSRSSISGISLHPELGSVRYDGFLRTGPTNPEPEISSFRYKCVNAHFPTRVTARARGAAEGAMKRARVREMCASEAYRTTVFDTAQSEARSPQAAQGSVDDSPALEHTIYNVV